MSPWGSHDERWTWVLFVRYLISIIFTSFSEYNQRGGAGGAGGVLRRGTVCAAWSALRRKLIQTYADLLKVTGRSPWIHHHMHWSRSSDSAVCRSVKCLNINIYIQTLLKRCSCHPVPLWDALTPHVAVMYLHCTEEPCHKVTLLVCYCKKNCHVGHEKLVLRGSDFLKWNHNTVNSQIEAVWLISACWCCR